MAQADKHHQSLFVITLRCQQASLKPDEPAHRSRCYQPMGEPRWGQICTFIKTLVVRRGSAKTAVAQRWRGSPFNCNIGVLLPDRPSIEAALDKRLNPAVTLLLWFEPLKINTAVLDWIYIVFHKITVHASVCCQTQLPQSVYDMSKSLLECHNET